jgi:hypothetical protein
MFMVDCVGCSGNLALLWKEEVELEIQNYSIRHINAVIKSEGMDFNENSQDSMEIQRQHRERKGGIF